MNEKRKVLAITYSFPPYNAGPVIRVSKFVKYLPLFGWEPVVLTVDPKYYPAYIYSDTSLLSEFAENIQIFRTPVLKNKYMLNLESKVFTSEGSKRPSFKRRFNNIFKRVILSLLLPDRCILWLPYAFKKGLQILKGQIIDIIFAVTPPHSTALVGYLLSRLTKTPLVIDVKDDWIGNPFFENKHKFLIKIEKGLERLVVSHAKNVISVTEESRDLFLKKYPFFNKDKFIVVPNGFDPDDFLNRKNRPPIRGSKIRVIYTGNLNIKRDPAPFLRALKGLDSQDSFQVFFVGLIHDRHKQVIKDLDLENIVSCIDYLSHCECINYLLNCDLCLLIIPEEEGSNTAIPGKIYEYIMAGKPILALTGKESASAKLIQNQDLGWVCDFRDKDAIKVILMEILGRYKGNKLHLQGKRRLLKKYNRKNLTERLSNILEEIVRVKA